MLNQTTLRQWDVPCPVKAENPNWPTLLKREIVRAGREYKASGKEKSKWWLTIGRPAPVVIAPPAEKKKETPLNQKEFARRAGLSLYAVRKLEREGKLEST